MKSRHLACCHNHLGKDLSEPHVEFESFNSVFVISQFVFLQDIASNNSRSSGQPIQIRRKKIFSQMLLEYDRLWSCREAGAEKRSNRNISSNSRLRNRSTSIKIIDLGSCTPSVIEDMSLTVIAGCKQMSWEKNTMTKATTILLIKITTRTKKKNARLKKEV